MARLEADLNTAEQTETQNVVTFTSFDGKILVIPDLPPKSQVPALFDEIREGLGTSKMSLEDMILEMRKIREDNDYEGKA